MYVPCIMYICRLAVAQKNIFFLNDKILICMYLCILSLSLCVVTLHFCACTMYMTVTESTYDTTLTCNATIILTILMKHDNNLYNWLFYYCTSMFAYVFSTFHPFTSILLYVWMLFIVACLFGLFFGYAPVLARDSVIVIVKIKMHTSNHHTPQSTFF